MNKFNIGDRVIWTCPNTDKSDDLYHTHYLAGQSFIGTVFDYDIEEKEYHIVFDVENKCFHSEFINGTWIDEDRCYIVREEDLVIFKEILEINSNNSDTIFTEAKNIIKEAGKKAAAIAEQEEQEKLYKKKLKSLNFKFKPGDFVTVINTGLSYPTYREWHGFSEAGVSNENFSADVKKNTFYKVLHCSVWVKKYFMKDNNKVILVLLQSADGKLHIVEEGGCKLA